MSESNSPKSLPVSEKKMRVLLRGLIIIGLFSGVLMGIFLNKKPEKLSDNTHKSVQSGSNKPHQFSAKIYELVQKKRCAGCHGTRGQGRLSITAPPLAGQSKEMLINKIKRYRSGEIDNPAMQLMTRDLSDQEIELLADYYSHFK